MLVNVESFSVERFLIQPWLKNNHLPAHPLWMVDLTASDKEGAGNDIFITSDGRDQSLDNKH